MLSVEKPSKKFLIIRLVIEAVLLIGLVLGNWYIYQHNDKPVVQNKVVIPKPQKISSNLLFTGNIYWGRYINDWSMASDLKYQYPFSRLNEFNRDQYNAWISGLECPVVSGVDMTSDYENNTLQFNCSPDYLSEAAKWFTIVSLANNHTDNQGADGFVETKQHLEEAGIQYFGHYDPYVVEDNCEVIGLPVTVINDNGSKFSNSLPVAMCGFHGVFKIPPDEAIAEMQKYSDYMPVIAMPHMGVEYRPAPDELKTAVYRSMIDNGADMVIGDHPHWVQTSESYNGHLIFYSMGNFMFDQQGNDEVARSASVNVLIEAASDDTDNLDKWLSLGPDCIAFKDDCLSLIKDQNLTKLNFTYKLGVVGSNNINHLTKPATPAQQTGILQRLNWQNTINGLQAPYSSL